MGVRYKVAHYGPRSLGNGPVRATGGTETVIEQDGKFYRVHSFTDVGENNFEVLRDGKCDVLVVAGGGGGGNSRGGGGGAGGLIFRPDLNVSNGSIQVSVGAEGLHISGGNPGTDGEDSSFANLTAIGGGGGGAVSRSSDPNIRNGRDGGSGGGARRGQSVSTFGGSGIQTNQSGDSGAPFGFGNDGGSNPNGGDNGTGGGGAGGPGLQGSGTSNVVIGGIGLNEVNINGSLYNFAKMFGTQYGEIIDGEAWFAGGGAGDGGLVSKGGGGQGSRVSQFSGLPNTGGGGGGSRTDGGTDGGSGIVIVRYRITEAEFNAA